MWVLGAAARDDDLDSVLDGRGLEVQRFTGLEELLDGLDEHTPALLLVDADVFDASDRLEAFVERLRGQHEARFPTLVLTDQIGGEWRRRLYRAGVDDWVAKPVVVAELRARVWAQLARYSGDGQAGDGQAGDGQAGHKPAGTVTKLDSPLSVLVCDDDAMIHRVLRSAFERRGWFVSEARDGREALDMAAEHDFDMAVFDLNLPYANGFELLDAFAEMGAGGPSRSVILSAERQPESVLRAFRFGADDFVGKPVDPDILVARMQRLIRPSTKERRDD
ncbi:MAG: response regulator [Persicimonas sp.]